jgi:ferredoxin
MKAFSGIKASADFRAYARGSKCAGCPRWGACATKCKLDAADIKAAKAGMNKAAKAEKGEAQQ